jgi:FkbM family methyltransferase
MKRLFRPAWRAFIDLRYGCNLARIFRQIRLENNRKKGRPFVAKMPGIDALMTIYPNMYFSNTYAGRPFEPEVVSFTKQNVKQGMTVLDIGANIGFLTLLYARLVGPKGQVVAFEPGIYAARLLKENLAINRFSWVSVIEQAAGEIPGRIRFFEGPEGFDVYSSSASIVIPAAQNVPFIEREVEKVTVDEIVHRERISRVDLVKIDVEGYELFVLRGLRHVIEQNPSITLVIEVSDQLCAAFGHSAFDVIREIENMDLQCWQLGSKGSLETIDRYDPTAGGMVVARLRC